jgi:hypothetical protein
MLASCKISAIYLFLETMLATFYTKIRNELVDDIPDPDPNSSYCSYQLFYQLPFGTLLYLNKYSA